MKLYYSPLACSLADHIALFEVGVAFESERVDLKTKQLASGADLREISPKGYVPVLVLDDGTVLTENIAILDWLATQFPTLAVPGDMGRTRVLEMLAFISTELHRAFKPMWHSSDEAQREHARSNITRLFGELNANLQGEFLFGQNPSVADFYLFVMLLWAERFRVPVPEALAELRSRMTLRPTVQAALRAEGLAKSV